MDVNKYDDVLSELDGLSDEALSHLMAATPWQGSPPGDLAPSVTQRPAVDEDGFMVGTSFSGDLSYTDFSKIQSMCWYKFQTNPFVFTTVLDVTGRLAGYGFSQHSSYPRADDVIEEVWTDPRNGLISNFSKYMARSFIQGELFLSVTLHPDGFVEVDFVSPSVVKGFDNGSGILMAKGKPMFPLMYQIQESSGNTKFIPSINLAYYPELWKQVEGNKNYQKSKLVGKRKGKAYKELRDQQTFIIQFDQGFVTQRNVGRVRVTLEWLEYYTDLKKFEMDHKKSSGAYLWAITIADRQAFRMWLAMSEEEREKTGLLKKKVPGGTIMLPPGFTLECNNPKLSSISNQDTDILKMISAGLNIPEDVMTGSSTGQTYSGAKLSRGPLADRIKDHVVEVDRWLIHGFWRGVLWLNHKATGMPWKYKVRKAYKFENQKPKFKNILTEAHKTIEINFPISEMGDIEAKARAFMGVKHGSVVETLGLSRTEVANSMGTQNYHQARLDLATEDDTYPELLTAAEIEMMQSKSGEEGLEKSATPKEPVKPIEKKGISPVERDE